VALKDGEVKAFLAILTSSLEESNLRNVDGLTDMLVAEGLMFQTMQQAICDVPSQ
jgi:hypothetical protein